MQDRDDFPSVADLQDDRRVVRVLMVPGDPTSPRERLLPPKDGLMELEDISRQGLPEGFPFLPPDIIPATLHPRILSGSGGLHRRDCQGGATAISDTPTHVFLREGHDL